MPSFDLQAIIEILRPRLADLYGDELAPWLLDALMKRAVEFRRNHFLPERSPTYTERDALLITYANSIIAQRTPPLKVLHSFLREHIGYKLSMLHILPFFPSSSDDGYAVMDYREVNEEVGSWDDIQAIAGDYRTMFDGVINHVSAFSSYFQAYQEGREEVADFFIEVPSNVDVSGVRRVRDASLLHDYQTHDGIKLIWGTYGRDTLDLNFANPHVLLEVIDILLFYASRGAAIIRLNDAPLLWKEVGTNCANLPRTHQLIRVFRDVLDLACPHVQILADACEPDEENYAYIGDGTNEAHMIYNYGLPPLLLYCILKGDASILSDWAENMRPLGRHATYLNVTATHENIGLDPTEGYLNDAARRFLVEVTLARRGKVINRRDEDGTVIPCELNVNYYDAINDPAADEDEDVQISRFLLSQAVPLSLMGVPGIYIHSLLGSCHEGESLTQFGSASSKNMTAHQVMNLRLLERALADPNSMRSRIFTDYCRMLELRAKDTAFHPNAEQTVLHVGDSAFTVKRRNSETGAEVICLHNFSHTWAMLGTVALDEVGRLYDVIDGTEFEVSPVSQIRLAPYQVRWLKRMGKR